MVQYFFVKKPYTTMAEKSFTFDNYRIIEAPNFAYNGARYYLYKKEPIARTIAIGVLTLGTFPLFSYVNALLTRNPGYMPGWNLMGAYYNQESVIRAKVADQTTRRLL